MLTNFTNPYSEVEDSRGNINKQAALIDSAATQEINASSGVIQVQSGATSVALYNKLISPNSLINFSKITPSGAVISGYVPGTEAVSLIFSTAPTADI